jgi:hypothetical protein
LALTSRHRAASDPSADRLRGAGLVQRRVRQLSVLSRGRYRYRRRYRFLPPRTSARPPNYAPDLLDGGSVDLQSLVAENHTRLDPDTDTEPDPDSVKPNHFLTDFEPRSHPHFIPSARPAQYTSSDEAKLRCCKRHPKGEPVVKLLMIDFGVGR